MFLSSLERITYRTILLFVALFVVSFPFSYNVFPEIGSFLAPYFEGIIGFIGDDILRIEKPYTKAILSDSTGLYIHCFFLLLLSFGTALIWSFLYKHNGIRIRLCLHWGASYYLSLQLLIYGFNKIFKHQFYLPEPNTLYTPIGETSSDLLFWTVMGSSWLYSFFSGLLEVIPAVLLLFGKTRKLGAFIAFGVLLNVLFINLSFDISVKLYSFFLLSLAFLILTPYLKSLYAFFIQRQEIGKDAELVEGVIFKENSFSKNIFTSFGKALLCALFFLEALFPYFKTNNFNDDLAPRPYLHGAYEITNTNPLDLHRLFVHRKGYLITQTNQGEMQDYQLNVNPQTKEWILLDCQGTMDTLDFVYYPEDSLLQLQGQLNGIQLTLESKTIDWQKLPLLKKSIHWTIDDY